MIDWRWWMKVMIVCLVAGGGGFALGSWLGG